MTDTPDTSSQDRIAKVMARAGLCSRREAEAWIAEGRVTVNGATLTTPAVTVGPDDTITVDGKPLPVKERTRLWLYHKPRGLVTTAFDPQGRPTVFERLPEGLPRVMSVGRLDINTEGLLLLTNDGGLSRILELPTTGWLRKYRVRAHGQVTQAQLDRLKDGVAVDGVLYGGIEAKIDHDQGANIWMTIGLREGKNREIKNVLGSLGMEVSRLIRISFGPFQLGDIPLGEADEVAGRTLRDQLGARLIEAAGADFSAPVNQQPTRAEPGAHPPRQRSRSGGEPTDPRHRGDRPHGRDGDDRAAPGERGGYRGRQTKDGPERPRAAGHRDRPAGGGTGGEARAPRGAGAGRSGEGRSGAAPRSAGYRDRPEGGRSGAAPRSAGYRDRPGGEGADRRSGPGGGEGRPARPAGRYGSNDRPAGGRDEARGPRAAGGRPGEGRSAAPRSTGYRDRPGSDGAERRSGPGGGEGRPARPGGRFGSNDRPAGGRDEARGPRGAGPGRPGGGPRGAGGGRPGEGRPRPAPAGASDAPRKTFDRSGLRKPRPEGDRGETTGERPGGRPAGRGGAGGDRPQGRSGPGGPGGRSERPAGGSGGGYRGPGGSGPGRGPGGAGGNRGPRTAGGEGRGSAGAAPGGRDKRPGGQGRPGPGGPGGYRGPGGSGPGRGPGGPGGNRGPRKPGGPGGSGPKRGPRS
ncbi:pseudouridine synthase [Amorphus sp. MBR-141]